MRFYLLGAFGNLANMAQFFVLFFSSALQVCSNSQCGKCISWTYKTEWPRIPGFSRLHKLNETILPCALGFHSCFIHPNTCHHGDKGVIYNKMELCLCDLTSEWSVMESNVSPPLLLSTSLPQKEEKHSSP